MDGSHDTAAAVVAQELQGVLVESHMAEVKYGDLVVL